MSVAALAATLGAQDRIAPLPNQTWDGSTLITYSLREAMVEAPGRKAQVHALPEGLILLTVHEGVAWGVRMEGDPRKPAIWNNRGWTSWERVGLVDRVQSRIRGLFPLEEGRFLLYQAIEPFPGTANTEPAFLGVHRLREGRFEWQESVDLGLPLWARTSGGSGWSPRPNMEAVYSDLCFSFLQASGGHPYLVVGSLGKIFWFSPTRGHVQRVATVYGAVEEHRAKGEALAWPILGVRPTADGGLWAMCRSEDAVLHAKGDHPAPPAPVWTKEKPREHLVAELKKQVDEEDRIREKEQEAYPEVRWYRVWPDEATFRLQPAPAGLPERIRTLGDLKRFNFRVTLKGRPIPMTGDGLLSAPEPEKVPMR